MVQQTTAGTRVDRVYERLHTDLCNGRYPAGSRLKFPDLCAEYDTSVGVAREALTRLTAERLVALRPNQGYAVMSLSAGELSDLTFARVELEALTFRQSIAGGDDAWEAGVVAAHHLLKLRDREAAEGPPRDDEWYAAHEAFHASLLAGCGNRRLVEMAQKLRAEAEIYRRWATGLLDECDRDPAAEHAALADAAVNRDVDRGADLLREHITCTSQMLLLHLSDGGPHQPESHSDPK